jgi:hypothetical protein
VGRAISLIIPADRAVEEERIIARLRAGDLAKGRPGRPTTRLRTDANLLTGMIAAGEGFHMALDFPLTFQQIFNTSLTPVPPMILRQDRPPV